MEIIRRGVPPSEKTWIGKCRACRSEARATTAELTNITDDQREGTSFSWETCPVCGKSGWGGMLFYPEVIT